jgi:4-nitrophenyl phosphatase
MIHDHFPDVKGLIIDMDGVLWHDTEPIGDLPGIFEQIRTLDLRFILATNNATRNVEEYLGKLAKFGVHLEPEQVINTSQATGIFLREKFPSGAAIYVIGTPSLRKMLQSFGFTIAESKSTEVEIVVASLDFSLTYEKLSDASLLIQSGCEFIGTNPDVTLPTPQGFIPGAGTVVRALEVASGRKATIIGKPEPLLYEIALKRLGTQPEETLAIGDRLETDIAGAQAAGIKTALVLSGASTLEHARQFTPPPDVIVNDFTELVY